MAGREGTPAAGKNRHYIICADRHTIPGEKTGVTWIHLLLPQKTVPFQSIISQDQLPPFPF